MLAVVVLTYRPAAGMLEGCLESVLTSGDADVVVLVDNGGAVASGTARVPDDPRVEVLELDDNRGYAGGMNAGMRRALDAGADVVALLNDDTVVRPGWLATLAAGLDDASRVGAVQPKLLLARTDPPRLNSAGVRVRADGAGIDIGHGEIDAGQYDRPGWISAFTGGAVALSRSMLLDVGGFDERYFMYLSLIHI